MNQASSELGLPGEKGQNEACMTAGPRARALNRSLVRRPTFYRGFLIAVAISTGILYQWFIHSSLLLRAHLSVSIVTDEAEDWASLSVGTVKWSPCPNLNAPAGLEKTECGFVIVPLDYFNHSAGVAKVALARLQATKSPRKGMVLFNPGGPGGSGVDLIQGAGPSLQFMTGEDYDAVGFDPRGIGGTLPSVQCFTQNDYELFKVNTILERGFDVAPDLSDPKTRDHLLVQQRNAQSLYKTQFETCNRVMGDTLRYMGTSTVARDIDFITRALEGEETPINFYGFSYGTIIGAYLVNMFPDRVGRVIIDGVADAVGWAEKPSYTWYRDWLGYTEATYDLFLAECSKVGPSICPLAKSQNEDPADIDKRIEDFYAELYYEPLAVPDAYRPGILTQSRARIPLLGALTTPLTWRQMAITLSEAMKGNGSALLSQTQFIKSTLPRSAVSCNDNIPQKIAPTVEEIVDEALYTLKHVTRFALTVVTTEPDAGCEFWPVTPPERFDGPWNQTLAYPILIHSNLLDPVTPMSSGKATKALLGSSARLVLREGPGHCSTSVPSLCVAKINQQYFGNGTLPEDGYLCGIDMPLFPSDDPQDFAQSMLSLSAEDRVLMEHLYTLNKYFSLSRWSSLVRQVTQL